MALDEVVPLDPDSPEGKEAAEALTDFLARMQLAIADREREAAAKASPARERRAA